MSTTVLNHRKSLAWLASAPSAVCDRSLVPPGRRCTPSGYLELMPVYIKTVTFDCADAMVVARFWADALGTDVDDESTRDRAYVEAPGWGGPNMWFVRVPEPKTAKNRMHFDLRAQGEVRFEVARLVSLGATVVEAGADLTVMRDPEGNEFCVE